jgi:hypothetical protein
VGRDNNGIIYDVILIKAIYFSQLELIKLLIPTPASVPSPETHSFVMMETRVEELMEGTTRSLPVSYKVHFIIQHQTSNRKARGEHISTK